MIEDFIVNGRFFDVVIALFVWRLFYNGKKQPNNNKLGAEVARLKADIETSYVEVWDYIEQTMKPIRSRLETRARRDTRRDKQETEDLKDTETKKKGGLMRPSQYKDYGNPR